MKVILLKDIARLGKRGEIKEVANVYAVNVLIPKKQAVQATSNEVARWKQIEETRKREKELTTSLFQQLIERLHGEQIVIAGKKHDEKGQLFAQVRELDIARAIFDLTKIAINQKQITIPKPIKSLGLHEIEIKQGQQKESISIEVK